MILGFSLLVLAGCGNLSANVQQVLIPLPADIVKGDVVQRLRMLRIEYPGFDVRVAEAQSAGLHGKSAALSLVSKGGSSIVIHLPFEYNYRFDENNMPYIVYHPSDDELSRGMTLALESYGKVYEVALQEFGKAELLDEGGALLSMTMLSLDPSQPKTPRWHVTLMAGETEVAGTLINGYTGEVDDVVVY